MKPLLVLICRAAASKRFPLFLSLRSFHSPPLQARKFEPSRLAACAKTNFELGALAWHQAATEVQGLLCLMACVYNSLAAFQRSVAFGSRQACLNRWPQRLFSIQIAQRPSHAGVRSCAASSDLPSACLSSRNCEILAPRPGSSLNVRMFLLTSAFRLTCARSVGFPNSPPSSSVGAPELDELLRAGKHSFSVSF